MDQHQPESQGALQELPAAYAALDSAQAIIEFSADGIVQRANSNFLRLSGYGADEQSLTAKEVGVAISYIAQETERSAGSCDSIARSTEGPNTNAERLSNAVGRFAV